MVIFQYCNTCKNEETHELRDGVITCKKCNKKIKLKGSTS